MLYGSFNPSFEINYNLKAASSKSVCQKMCKVEVTTFLRERVYIKLNCLFYVN